jgi:hypothetical protein
MHTWQKRGLPIVAGLLLAVVGCGDDDGGSTIPTTDDLVNSLLTTDDLGVGWREEFVETQGCRSPEDCPEPFDGVITDEMREDMGGIDMCPEAGDEAVAAGAGLTDKWQVTRAFTLEVDNPEQNSVSLAESLLVGEVQEITSLFDVLKEGFRICLDVPPPDDEVHIGDRELALPDLGDDRFGFLLSLGDEENRWDIRAVLVRSGGTVLALAENEILSGDSALTDEDLTAISVTAADKLP